MILQGVLVIRIWGKRQSHTIMEVETGLTFLGGNLAVTFQNVNVHTLKLYKFTFMNLFHKETL